MADFRKWMLLLAVLALSATSAFGQASCTLNPASNVQMRGGGITELTGDITMLCTNHNPVGGADVTVNFQSAMSGTSAVTNRVTGDQTDQGFPLQGAALQVATTPQPPLAGTGTELNAIQLIPGFLQPAAPGATTTAGANLVTFYGVVLPAGSTVVVRITNIRVAAPTVAATSAAVSIFETISTNNPNQVPITNALQLVGTVLPALQFVVTDCAGGSISTLSFQQCISQPTGGAGALSFGVRFTEFGGVAAAFKTKAQESGKSLPTVPPGATATITDPADNGTRLLVRFTGIPSGVKLFVTDRNIAVAAPANNALARLVKGADVDGTGGTTFSTGTEPATCGEDAAGKPIPTVAPDEATPALVQASTSGDIIYAVWEVTDANPNLVETLLFGVQVAFTSNTTAGIPALSSTPGTITGTFAPVSTVIQADVAPPDGSPLPRFVDLALPGTAPFVILPCVTNLLFPYVTNTAGYDTGIALINTSLDNSTGSSGTPKNQPFNTPTQHGPCTVYFFGNMDIAPQTTTDFGPGGATQDANGRDVLIKKFTMTFPLDEFSASLAGFEGYIIARCNFQFAHGFAFIVDGHVPGFGSEAYLAMIIPDTGSTKRAPSPFSAAGAGTGEQLVH